MITYKTAESVCAGHPDKLCDLIADSILDACLRKDKSSRVACEVMATKGKIIVAGEITCDGKVDIRWEVREVLRKVGYNPWKFTVFVFVHKQSKDIDAGVTTALEARNGSEERYASLGAGDQGTVYGYATNETREMLPLPLVLAHRICKRVDTVRKDKIVKGILPDGKAQVTVEYEDGKPKRVKTIVISVQHDKDKTQEQLCSDLKQNVLWQSFEDFPFDDDTEIFINPSGRFVEGGPAADTGLTGRKTMVDTCGGLALHGGGAFSGKDPTKVDRSGAYMARYIAKNIVWSDLAERCEVALSYETLVTISSSATSGSYETAASTVAGTYTRYRISVTDTLGAISAYVVSGAVKKNSPPAAPIVAAPKTGSATYNAQPRFLITTGTEPDGQVQQVCVKIGTAEWQDSVNNPERFSQGGYLGNGVKTVFRPDDNLPAGSVTAVFRCLDEGISSSSPEVSCVFTVLASPFESITEHETKVKAEHIRAIREAVNAVRGYYGLAAANWSENIIVGKTAIKNWPYHILEIRAALESVIDFINQFDTVAAFDVPEVDWLHLGTGRPQAAVMRQIQDLILAL